MYIWKVPGQCGNIKTYARPICPVLISAVIVDGKGRQRSHLLNLVCAKKGNNNMNSLRDKLERFMIGRYGIDSLGKATWWTAVVLLVLSVIFGRNGGLASLLNTFSMVALVYTCYRALSRDIQRRYQENKKFLSMTAELRGRIDKEKKLFGQRRYYHFYKCPGCSTVIRMPRGKGTVEIRCPKCGTKFVKRS